MIDDLSITIIILTYNEEKNLLDCLNSAIKLSNDIVIVDSFSTDSTLVIAEQFNCKIYKNPFENYSKQRNWALNHVQIDGDWIVNIDADHRLTNEIISEIKSSLSNNIPPDVVGFMTSRKTMFMNRWIKHGGHYPVYHGFMFKKGFGFCEDKEYDQHFVIQGNSKILNGGIIDIISDSLTNFTTRHNKWASLEANDILEIQSGNFNQKIIPDKDGNLMEKRRYQRLKYYSYPLFGRVFLYFFYRYIIKMGFRDGKEGLVFHFLQGFWFRFLVDAKIYEIKKQNKG